MLLTIFNKDIYLFIKILMDFRLFYTTLENNNAINSFDSSPSKPIFLHYLTSLCNSNAVFMCQRLKSMASFFIHSHHIVSINNYALLDLIISRKIVRPDYDYLFT